MKEKIKLPQKASCHRHKKPCKDCKDCRRINRQRKEIYMQEITWRVGEIIYKNWDDHLIRSKESSKSLAGAVLKAKKSMHSLCPWDDKCKVGQQVWKEVIDDMVKKMNTSYIPVTKTDGLELWD